MAQNIYDRSDFFAGYGQLERSIHGLAGAAEWPLIQTILPDPAGLRVVDLGCGFGWFSRWAREHGAASVLGIDLSEKMLARARADTADQAITYQRADLEHLALPHGAFDLAYSSLAFHYIHDLGRLLSAIHRGLVPGGRLVFSVEHPVLTAPTKPDWAEDADGAPNWPLNRYMQEGARVTDWLVPGVVKYHRTLDSIVTAVLAAGFTLRALKEYAPNGPQVAQRPEWARERERPLFLILAASR